MEAAPTSKFLLQKGWIKGKNRLFEKKKFAALCAPCSLQEIETLHGFLFGRTSSQRGLDERCIPFLGSIAYSAVQQTPFLILLDSETSTENPVFIHLDSLKDVKDEEALGIACSFGLDLEAGELKFQCFTSIDYQNWITALDFAFQIVHSSNSSLPQIQQPNFERLNTVKSLASSLPKRRRLQLRFHEIRGSNASLDNPFIRAHRDFGQMQIGPPIPDKDS